MGAYEQHDQIMAEIQRRVRFLLEHERSMILTQIENMAKLGPGSARAQMSRQTVITCEMCEQVVGRVLAQRGHLPDRPGTSRPVSEVLARIRQVADETGCTSAPRTSSRSAPGRGDR